MIAEAVSFLKVGSHRRGVDNPLTITGVPRSHLSPGTQFPLLSLMVVLEDGVQLALMMRMTEAVETLGKGPVCCESIMHGDSLKDRQEIHRRHREGPPMPVNVIIGQGGRTGTVEPVQSSRDANPRLIEVEDGFLRKPRMHALVIGRQPIREGRLDVIHGAFADPMPGQIFQEIAEALHGQQLIGAPIAEERFHPRSILDRVGDLRGKLRCRFVVTGGTDGRKCAMLGDFDPGHQVEDLASIVG